MKGVSVPAAFGVRASPDYVWQVGCLFLFSCVLETCLLNAISDVHMVQANGRILRLPQIQWAIGPDAAFHYNALGTVCVSEVQRVLQHGISEY